MSFILGMRFGGFWGLRGRGNRYLVLEDYFERFQFKLLFVALSGIFAF